MKYRVALFRSDGGWSVSCPALPGCHSQGDTEEEALANIREAIREYLEVKQQLLEEEGALIREVELKGI
jgi:predicted RNase H-like HicB family nuclease